MVAGCGEEKGSTVAMVMTAEEEERGERVVERWVRWVVGDA